MWGESYHVTVFLSVSTCQYQLSPSFAESTAASSCKSLHWLKSDMSYKSFYFWEDESPVIKNEPQCSIFPFRKECDCYAFKLCWFCYFLFNHVVDSNFLKRPRIRARTTQGQVKKPQKIMAKFDTVFYTVHTTKVSVQRFRNFEQFEYEVVTVLRVLIR